MNFFLLAIVVNFATCLSQTCKSCNETCKTDPWKDGKFGNPGVKFRLNEKLVDLADNVASHKLKSLIKNLTSSDIKYSDLDVHNLKASNLKKAKFSRKLDFPLKWSFDNGTLVVKGNFSQHKSAGVSNKETDENIDGTITFISNLTSMDTTIYTIKDVEGRVTISSIICTAKVKNSNVTFEPEINITDPTKNFIVQEIENSFERLICSAATDKLKEFLNKNFLQNFQTKFNISSSGLTLDYGLTDNLKFTKNSSAVEGLMKAAVYIKNQLAYPFQPPDIVDKNKSNDSSWEFFMTSYPLNTLLYVSHQEKLLNFSANPKQMSKDTAELLSLNCESKNCLGSVFSNLSSLGPNAYATLNVVTTEPPKAAFNSSQAYMIIPKAKIELKVVDDSNTTVLLSETVSCIFANLTPKISQNTVYFVGNVTFLDLNTVKDVSSEGVAKLQNIIMKVFEELLNGFLSVGFPIPLVNGISLVQPKLELSSGTIYISDTPTMDEKQTYNKK